MIGYVQIREPQPKADSWYLGNPDTYRCELKHTGVNLDGGVKDGYYCTNDAIKSSGPGPNGPWCRGDSEDADAIGAVIDAHFPFEWGDPTGVKGFSTCTSNSTSCTFPAYDLGELYYVKDPKAPPGSGNWEFLIPKHKGIRVDPSRYNCTWDSHQIIPTGKPQNLNKSSPITDTAIPSVTAMPTITPQQTTFSRNTTFPAIAQTQLQTQSSNPVIRFFEGIGHAIVQTLRGWF